MIDDYYEKKELFVENVNDYYCLQCAKSKQSFLWNQLYNFEDLTFASWNICTLNPKFPQFGWQLLKDSLDLSHCMGSELGPNFQTYDGYLRKALGYSRKYFDDRQVFLGNFSEFPIRT